MFSTGLKVKKILKLELFPEWGSSVVDQIRSHRQRQLCSSGLLDQLWLLLPANDWYVGACAAGDYFVALYHFLPLVAHTNFIEHDTQTHSLVSLGFWHQLPKGLLSPPHSSGHAQRH